MTILVAGATGAIGKRLVPALVGAGYRVVGVTRTPSRMERLRAMGAQAVVADILDARAVRTAVLGARPEVVIHQVTSLAGMKNLRHFDREFAMTNRLRTAGTANLLAAAVEAGASRFVAQSYTGWPNERTGSRVKNEGDPLDPAPPQSMSRTLQAIRELESMVAGAQKLTGIVLRYGSFYGPGTSIATNGDIVEMVRQRKFPIFGDGGGVWAFIHIDDAAGATRRAVEFGPAGLYNIVDDEPAEVSEWLPALAEAIGAKPPLRLPAWLGRVLIGEAGLSMMTRTRGSSNTTAKRLLGWSLRYPTWREGFCSGLENTATFSSKTRV